MNKLNTSTFKLLFPALFLVIAANAQKLPNVQEAGLRAPSKVKIDGKTTEWNNQFQAYNHATNIFYTMANDDDNLYLVVQATDYDVINKIVGGGVTLTIQKSAKKNDKDNINITYPVIDGKGSLTFSLRPRKREAPDTTAKTADSIMKRNNKLIGEKCKWLRVAGVEGVDTLISVYNEDGIKAAALFDNKKVYTFELSIAFKHLKLSANDATKFTYHVRINGRKSLGEIKIFNMDGTPMTGPLAEKFNVALDQYNATMSAPTDFWGEYTLAKK